MTLTTAREQAIDLLERLRDEEASGPVSTGLRGLDAITAGGFRPGLVVFGGMPGVGKTAYALQTSVRVAQQGQPAVYFSAEQSVDELLARLLASEVGVPATALLDGEPHALADAFEAIDHLPLSSMFVLRDDRRPHGAVAHLSEIVAAVAEGRGRLPFVVVDYLQRLSVAEQDSSEDLRVAIGRNCSGLTDLVREDGITVFAVSSLNRSAYRQMPSLEAFKETGSIEFDADLAMILRRRDVEDGERPSVGDTSERELWIVKNRLGQQPAEPLLLSFDGRLGSFAQPQAGSSPLQAARETESLS